MSPIPQAVDQLAAAAGLAAGSGRWDEAERLWREVHKVDPSNPQALFSLGVHAIQRRDWQQAGQLLAAARSALPNDPLIPLHLASLCNARGDPSGEREFLDSALQLDPYFLPALLAKAGWFERSGNLNAAATTYANCLKIAPVQSAWPDHLIAQLQHARELAARYAQEYGRHLSENVAKLAAELPSTLATRWREAISVMAGLSKPYHVDCNQLYVARLPAITFYDREYFPWLDRLESCTDSIAAELLTALQGLETDFQPYIAYRPGEPVNQWQELNHSKRWSVLSLWQGGQPVPDSLMRCPQTAAALSEVSMADIPGLCPNAMFSALAPRTHIPPHHGETNARLVAHLPLMVPGNCRFRVGFDERQWRRGEAFVFDDTLEHEATNDSDQLRVVLIFDVWNPLLTEVEQHLVRALTEAAKSFSFN